jgi:RNA polymerase sigma-70 factor (ECF subfamily)
MPNEPSESLLVARARQGDKEAFGDLYELYLTEMYRYVFYRVNNQLDAEDLTEQVFLKAWKNLSEFRGKASFRSWIYRIAYGTVIDHYRTRKLVVALDENNSPEVEDPLPEQQVINQEKADLMAYGIRQLAPLQQHVLILRFISGFSTEETAEIVDRSAGTVRVIQHRALKAMQALLLKEDMVNE